MEPIFVDKEVYPADLPRLEEGNQIAIHANVQTLLRRWIKERDALENQINGVLQSLVVGYPGVWDLDDSITHMVRRALVATAGKTE